MSAASKPVTFSVKVTVIGTEASFVGLVADELIATPGMVLSTVMENWGAAVLALPATSVATPAPILAVTAPLAVGAMLAVYVLASICVKLLSAPFVTVMSEAMKLLTSSVNVTVIGIEVSPVGLVAEDVID